MKIESYQVQASSQRSYQKTSYQHVSGELWGAAGGLQQISKDGDAVNTSLSDVAKQMLEDAREKGSQLMQKSAGVGGVGLAKGMPTSKEELKLQLLDNFLYQLTGRRLSPMFSALFGQGGGLYARYPFFGGGFSGAGQSIGGRVEATSFEYEAERVSYNAQGVIKTDDGKTVNVDISLAMSREFARYSSTTLEFGAPRQIDPLVINYGGNAASLTGEKYAFDLDADGVMDQISFAGAGSGFLALDKNGDGTINDGSELFGPNTGNGFAELRNYDKDGNHWIDENDAVFSQLRIWSKDADGNDQLFTLQQLGIGAIYLGDVATEFSLNDAENNTQGTMRSTSFFLRENGGAGTISHIDLVV